MASNGWYNFCLAMKKFALILMIVLIGSSSANAGLLSGSAVGFTEKKGDLAIGVGLTAGMFETPIVLFNSSCNYAVFDNLNVFGKLSSGALDYSTISGYILESAVTGITAGIEYNIFRPEKSNDHYNLIVEHESTNWDVNGSKNISSCTTIGAELIKKISEVHKRKVMIAMYYFNSSQDVGPKIISSAKFGITSEENYEFNRLIAGYIEGGIFGGDETGTIVYFGTGLNFNFYEV